MFNLGASPNLPTVLLIDDDMVSREVMATVLTMTGYTVHTADGGEAALELLADATWGPDVVLMDAQMPGLSGVPLVAQLRAASNADIYAVSGSNPPAELIAACDGFLLKPFPPDALTRLLQKHSEKATPPVVSALDPRTPVVNPETLAQLRSMMPEAGVRQAIKGGCSMAGAAQAAAIGTLLENGALKLKGNHLDNDSPLLKHLRTATLALQSMLETEFPA